MTTIAWDAVSKILASDSQWTLWRKNGKITKLGYESRKVQPTRFKRFFGQRVMAYGMAGTVITRDMVRLQFTVNLEKFRSDNVSLMVVTEDAKVYVYDCKAGWSGWGENLSVFIGSGAAFEGTFFDRVAQDPYSGGKFYYTYSLYTGKLTKGLLDEAIQTQSTNYNQEVSHV